VRVADEVHRLERRLIATALLRHRRRRGLRLTDVARQARVSSAAIRRYEQGVGDVPLVVGVRLADAWGITLDELLMIPPREAEPRRSSAAEDFFTYLREARAEPQP
jgi:predicted transcriptional regulator